MAKLEYLIPIGLLKKTRKFIPGHLEFKKVVADVLRQLNVPFVDECCPALNNVDGNAGTQTLTGAGAVSLSTYATLLVTTGANALTLGAGTEGQKKFIRMKTDGGDGTLTVTNGQGFTTLTFNDAGDFVELFYLDSKWHIMTNSGATAA